jgi:hypothetical protein
VAGVAGDGPIDMTAAVAEFHRAFGLPARQVPSADVDGAARVCPGQATPATVRRVIGYLPWFGWG